MEEVELGGKDFHEDTSLIALICQLFSRETLVGSCKQLGLSSTGNKDALVANLLVNGWVVPSDQEAQKAYRACIYGNEEEKDEKDEKEENEGPKNSGVKSAGLGKENAGKASKKPEHKEKEVKVKEKDEIPRERMH